MPVHLRSIAAGGLGLRRRWIRDAAGIVPYKFLAGKNPRAEESACLSVCV